MNAWVAGGWSVSAKLRFGHTALAINVDRHSTGFPVGPASVTLPPQRRISRIGKDFFSSSTPESVTSVWVR